MNSSWSRFSNVCSEIWTIFHLAFCLSWKKQWRRTLYALPSVTLLSNTVHDSKMCMCHTLPTNHIRTRHFKDWCEYSFALIWSEKFAFPVLFLSIWFLCFIPPSVIGTRVMNSVELWKSWSVTRFVNDCLYGLSSFCRFKESHASNCLCRYCLPRARLILPLTFFDDTFPNVCRKCHDSCLLGARAFPCLLRLFYINMILDVIHLLSQRIWYDAF